MKRLKGRMLQIASGNTELPAEVVKKYQEMWRAAGFELPDYEQQSLVLCGGVGTEVKKLLSRIGIIPKKNCKCNRRAAEMDRKGVEWCEQNIEQIINWLQEGAEKRPVTKIVFTRWRARQAILQAIRKAKKKERQHMLENVTACITHHKRPESLQRLLASIRKFYPNLKILIEDTEGNLSSARNRLYTKCETDYILMLEEDFVFTEKTKIEKLLTVLGASPTLGGVGGCTHEPKAAGTVNRGGNIWWDRDFKRIREQCYLTSARRSFKSTKGISNRHCDIIINFGLFRKQMFEDVPWPEDFPVMEHTPWYWEVYRDARWHFSYVPEVMIDHYRTRPTSTYIKDRNRNFSEQIKKKYGIRFNRDSLSPNMNTPNVVVLSVGRSNSTIITKMAAHAFNLALGNIDRQYYEHVTVRSLNSSVWQGKPFDKLEARRVLRALPQPWIIKDPRFRRTFNHWKGPLQEFDPLLLYLPAAPATVKESYDKQNWTYDPADHARCDDIFDKWSGKKLKIDADQIGIACSFFDFSRMKHIASAGT